MWQVLFHIPIFKDRFPPDGIPIHGFGVMLFVTFLVCVWVLGRLAMKWGTRLPKERVQDLVIVVFLSGLVGARITYMIQYRVPFSQFVRIWEGGIVLYGGIITGMLAFLLFYRWVLKPAGVSMWKLADASAPALALGIALGRVGCFLNGCCYGHIADEGAPAIGFPLLTCPARDVVVDRQGYQTPTGFTVRSGDDDIRSVVDRVEPESAAEKAGLRPGDKIVGVNGQPNVGVLLVSGPDAALEAASRIAREQGATVTEEDAGAGGKHVKIVVEDSARFHSLNVTLKSQLLLAARVLSEDTFSNLINAWPRGRQELELEVDRAGQRLTVGPFIPRTLGLHPTQVYESISMLLLAAFLVFYYPFRHHDGQVITLFIFCYAIHRFLNESLRNDTEIVGIPQLRMTLSQNISILMILFAIGLEVGLRAWNRRKTRLA
ncbi:MAG TPA: prolipoprotein diacylglyceryl transferase family protein [Gemmataceae bacterium]|nr:prolipoprotein diacylglyceryl transferase family protein [Gemmataceae bacterium]